MKLFPFAPDPKEEKKRLKLRNEAEHALFEKMWRDLSDKVIDAVFHADPAEAMHEWPADAEAQKTTEEADEKRISN
jgi:hypothetical protein